MKTQQTRRLPARDIDNITEMSHGSEFRDLYVKYRSEKSFFGYDPSVLKSGIQKYARRDKVEKGLWCLVEMDSFSLLEWGGPALDAYLRKYPEEIRKNTKTAAMRIRTNMVNRLVVMMSEEVNISAWWMPLKIFDLYQKWIKNRGNAISRKFLMDMYYFLTSQKMIRLISDIKSVYLVPPDYVKPKQMKDLTQIHDKIQERYPEIYSGQAAVGELDWDFGLDDYMVSLHPCIRGIVYNLEKDSDHVFFWIKKLCELEKEHGATKYRYVKFVWSVLHRFIDRHREGGNIRKTVSALEFFFKKMGHREKPIYLYHAILLWIRRHDIDWSAELPRIDTSRADVERRYRNHLAGGIMPMDDYILDLHTRMGKRGDNCLENFALEGAYIENENLDFLRPDYREIYVLLKKELDLYYRKIGK
jgi:hypothetical protein